MSTGGKYLNDPIFPNGFIGKFPRQQIDPYNHNSIEGKDFYNRYTILPLNILQFPHSGFSTI